MLDYLYKPKATIRVKYNMRKRQKQNINKFSALSKIEKGMIIIFGYFVWFAIWIGALIELINGGKHTLDKHNLPWYFACISLVPFVYVFDALFSKQNNYYVYELTPKGITRTLFKFKHHRRLEIAWDEIYEMRCCVMANPMLYMFRKFDSFYLIISKTKLEEITLKQAYKRKDTLCFSIDNIDILNRIREYTDKEIIDLPPRLQNTDKT